MSAQALAGATATNDPNESVKKLYSCTASDVLCVDSCNGDILARYDGPTASFHADQGQTIRVRVVGHCYDSKSVQFSVSVNYRSSLSSITKNSTPAPATSSAMGVMGAPMADNGGPGAPAMAALSIKAANNAATYVAFDSTVSLGGTSSDQIAEVSVTRSGATDAPTSTNTSVESHSWSTAVADYFLRHGRYYIDFGVGGAIVPLGAQTISGTPYRGNPNDLRLTTDTSTPFTPLFSAVVFPAGHPRDALTVFDARSLRDVLGFFSLHVATELSRDTFLSTVYLGGGFDLVSGVTLSMGGAFVSITDYQAGAGPGLELPSSSSLSAMTRQATVWRPYFALSVSTEIYNSAKAAYTSVAGN